MMRIALAQVTASVYPEVNTKKAVGLIKEAWEEGAQLVVFPEYFMQYYPCGQKAFISGAQRLDGEFVSEMKRLAGQYGVWIVFGMTECGEKPNRVKNTVVILNDKGDTLSVYRKVHLFDAFHWKESDFTEPGDVLFSPITAPFGVFGVGLCYDLRYPELARYEALKGAQLLLYPSAWVKGKGKFRQWSVLIQARAIENGIFVAGCNHYSKDVYMGRSLVVDPKGEIVARGLADQELLIADMDLKAVQATREQIPSLVNRRPDLY